MWDRLPNSQKTPSNAESGRATDNGVAPGRIDTPLGKQHGGRAPQSSNYAPISAHSAAGITWRTLAERPSTPMPESGYDTGAGDVANGSVQVSRSDLKAIIRMLRLIEKESTPDLSEFIARLESSLTKEK